MLTPPQNNFLHTVVAAMLGMLLLVALQLTPHVPDVLRFDRSVFERGVLWPLLTSQLVHLSMAHAALNALAFMLSLLVWSRWVSLQLQLIGLAGGALGVALLLVFDTQASYYAGLSGALHGLWSGNAIVLWVVLKPDYRDASMLPARLALAVNLHADGRQGMAVLILAALVAKLWLQGADSPQRSLGWLQIPQYHPAHWAGLVGGVLLMLAVLLFRHLTSPRQQRN